LWLVPDTRFVGFAEVEMGLAATDRIDGGPVSAYVDWLGALVTFQWGASTYFDASVRRLYVQRLPITAVYVLPAAVVAVAVGTLLTTYATTDRDSGLARLLSVVGVTGLAVPAFLPAYFVFIYTTEAFEIVRIYDAELGLWHTQNLLRLQIAGGLVALALVGVQVRHVRSETVEHLQLPFVKTARAKGAGRRRIATHVFRNAWPSAASLVVGESLGVLLLTTVVVETQLNVPGVGVVVFSGFASGDPMVSTVALVGVVVAGVTGTLTVSLLRGVFDPRVGR
jgi:peptide/nickel transport system permease protein